MKRLLSSLILFALSGMLLYSQGEKKEAYYNKYYNCIQWENKKRAQKLISKGYSVDSEDPNGNTILLYCLKYNRIAWAEFFIDAGADVDHTDKAGNSCLHYAIENCYDTKIVKKLVEKGANPDVLNQQFYSPFHFSILFACPELPFYFIEKGVNYKRITALNENALHLSLEADCDTLTSWLLQQNINLYLQDNHGFTPLLTAVLFRKPEFVTRLIQLGADVNITDSTDHSCLYYSVFNQDTLSFKALLNAGARVKEDPGKSGLITTAADRENNYFIRELLKAGANDSLPSETHEEQYNLGLVYKVKSEMAETDSAKISYLLKGINCFSLAKTLYKKSENDALGEYTGEILYDIFSITSYLITGYDPGSSSSGDAEAAYRYYGERIKLCDQHIAELQKQMTEARNRMKEDGEKKEGGILIEL